MKKVNFVLVSFHSTSVTAFLLVLLKLSSFFFFLPGITLLLNLFRAPGSVLYVVHIKITRSRLTVRFRNLKT